MCSRVRRTLPSLTVKDSSLGRTCQPMEAPKRRAAQTICSALRDAFALSAVRGIRDGMRDTVRSARRNRPCRARNRIRQRGGWVGLRPRRSDLRDEDVVALQQLQLPFNVQPLRHHPVGPPRRPPVGSIRSPPKLAPEGRDLAAVRSRHPRPRSRPAHTATPAPAHPANELKAARAV